MHSWTRTEIANWLEIFLRIRAIRALLRCTCTRDPKAARRNSARQTLAMSVMAVSATTLSVLARPRAGTVVRKAALAPIASETAASPEARFSMLIISPTDRMGTAARSTSPYFHDAAMATLSPKQSDPNVCTADPSDCPVAARTEEVSVRKLAVSAPTEFAGSSKNVWSCLKMARNKCTRSRVVSRSPTTANKPPWKPESVQDANETPMKMDPNVTAPAMMWSVSWE